MYRIWIALSFLVILTTFKSNAQQLVRVMDQTFTVHSAGNLLINTNSNSRNIIEVQLPAKAIGYVYRVSSGKTNPTDPDPNSSSNCNSKIF